LRAVRRGLLVVLAVAAVAAPSADAHPPGPALGVAIEALRTVQVSYNTESGFTELEADAVDRRLVDSRDVTVALVAPAALLLAGPAATAREVASHVGRDGAYVVASGRQLGAWSTDIDAAEVDALVSQTRSAMTGQPPSVTVLALVDRLAARERELADDRAPAWLWPTVAVLGLVALLALAVVVRRRSPRGRVRPTASTGEG
jgi:hypothetical protein